MATVQTLDIVRPQVFNDLPAVDSPELMAFLESGLLVRSPMLDGFAREAGEETILPFWNDLDADDAPNISNDDPSDLAGTSKVTQSKQKTYTSHYNKAWQAADLASQLAMGADAIDHIRAKTEGYWGRRKTRFLVSAVQGVLADNLANNGGDMVKNVAVESIAAQDETTRFSSDAFVDAAYTMGDQVGGITAIAAHSGVIAQMAKQDGGLQNVYDSDGKILYRTYKEHRVIMDDSLPKIAGTTDGYKYVTVLFGSGAFGMGEGTPRVPTAVQRSELGGNGGGIELLINRKSWLIHPFGYQATAPATDPNGYTPAELESAATWTRIVERKLVPMAFLITN